MAVRLLAGIARDEQGRLSVPREPSNQLGLTMLRKLEVLSDADFDAMLVGRAQVDSRLREAYAANDQMKVREIEREYMQPLIDKCLADSQGIGRSCLACHADVPKQFPEQVDADSFYRNSVPDGVSCEACHGPSEQWWARHAEQAWRVLPPTEKQSLGLNDLRHPATRANQCYSCHIGDMRQGKFIEHAWYMAGHPPLPSVEVETFAHAMPRHWRYLKEKKTTMAKRDEFVTAIKNDKQSSFEIDTKFPRTKQVAVGGLIALLKSVALMADAHEKHEKAIIPDFAAFDCQACHQELRTRPILTRDEGRFDPLVPGRPNLPRWSFALADVAVDVAGNKEDRKEFDARIHDWREAMSRQPFGDRQKVGPAAEALQTYLQSLATRVAQEETTAELAGNAYERLKKVAQTELLDFHTARQVVWALQVIGKESGEAVPAGLEYPADNANLSNVGAYLQIKLPSGAKELITDEANLPQLLLRIDAYDPERFQALMKETLNVPE